MKYKTVKEFVASFEEKLDKSSLLDMSFDKEEDLEILTPELGSFFDSFVLGERYEFVTFFDRSFKSDDGKIDFNNQRILRKNRYQKNELIDKLNPIQLTPKKVTSCSLPFDQERALSFLDKKDDVFLTFGNLYYHQADKKAISVAPLVFFKIKIVREENTFFMVLDYNSPIYNRPLFRILKKQYGIDAGIDESSFDYQNIIKGVTDKLASLSFATDDSFNIIRADIFNDMMMSQVVEYKDKMSTDSVFRALDDPSLTSKSSYVGKNMHPSYVSDGLNFISSHDVTDISEVNPLSYSFLTETIDEYILHKDNVVYIAPTKQKSDEVRKKMESQFYDAFFSYKDITKPGTALFTLMESASSKPGYLVDSSLLMKKENLKSIDEKGRELDKRIKEISLPLDETLSQTYQNYASYKSKSHKLFKFDENDEYTYEDYLHDKDFVSFASSLKEFSSVPFTSHPFYGLNSLVKEENYDDIIIFLKSMVDDINKFTKAIEVSYVKLSGWSDFNSIKDFDDSTKLFSIFSKYDGFPISYFNVDFSFEVLKQINDLINYFRLEASIRLSIDVLCRPSIWNMDFKSILESVDDRKRLRELKKQMKSIIKIFPLKKNFKTLIVLIDKFQDNREKIEALIPELSKKFGNKVESLDGLLSIQKAHEFISSYQRHKKLFDNLDFSNAFTDKIFNDKDFSYAYKTTYYPNLIELRSVLEHDFDKYRKIFDEDKADYFSASFDQIIAIIEKRIKAKKSSFINYLSFSTKADSGSKELRDALLSEEKVNSSLENFSNDYFSSLYEFLMLKALDENNGVALLENRSDNLFEMYLKGVSSSDLSRIDTVKSFNINKSVLISKPSYLQTLKALKSIYHNRRMLSVREALKIGGDVFFHIFPFTISSFDKLDYLTGYKFDLAIIDLREGYDPLKLMLALMTAKKAIILGDAPDFNVSKLDINLNKDMVNYSKLNKYPSSFIDEVTKAYQRQNITIIKDKKINDYLTVPFYFEKNGDKFALREEEQEDVLTSEDSFDLSLFLYKEHQIKTVYLYPLIFTVYEDLSVLSSYRDVKEVEEQMNKKGGLKENLTYEQRRKEDYFQMLDKISSSFTPFIKLKEENENPSLKSVELRRSSLKERPIVNISYLEIAKGILTYLSYFTFLNEDVLIKRISEVVGTNEKDVDFRLLFLRSENYLLEKKVINKDGSKISIIR